MGFKLTTAEWLEKAANAHGDFFDYSKVKYVNARTNVEVGCPDHGYFWTNPRQHYLGHGCKKCANANLQGLYSTKYFDKFPDKKTTPAILYFLQYTSKDTGEVFYKTGITSNSISERVSIDKKSHYIEILMDRVMTLYDAYTKEQYILERFSEFKYRPKHEMRGGNTECLSRDITNEIKEI